MKKTAWHFLLVACAGLFVANTSLAVEVVVSGNDFFLLIDVDGDGPDEEDDCRYLVEFNSGTYSLRATQQTITLRACTGNFLLDLAAEGQDSSSDWVEMNKSNDGISSSGRVFGLGDSEGFLSEDYEIEIIDESGAPNGRPLDMNWIRLEDPPGGDNVKSELFICDDNGPTLAIEIGEDQLSIHLPFVPYPTANDPEYFTVRNIPFEQLGGGGGTLASHDVFFPVDDEGHFTVANADRPNDLFIDIDTRSLTDCDSLINLDPPEFRINSAISDAWFLPATAGQGFFIIVWEERKLIFMAWFTFDTERPPEDVEAILGGPGQRWMVALGPYTGDTAVLDVFVSSGMVFDSTMPPVTEEQLEGATITIRWTSCEQGFLIYNIPSLGLSGEIPIERIVDDNVADCVTAQAE